MSQNNNPGDGHDPIEIPEVEKRARRRRRIKIGGALFFILFVINVIWVIYQKSGDINHHSPINPMPSFSTPHLRSPSSPPWAPENGPTSPAPRPSTSALHPNL
jgi:hypothetical protein